MNENVKPLLLSFITHHSAFALILPILSIPVNESSRDLAAPL
jgi:hypothetical protein